MAGDKSVSIKAYLDLGGGRQEVRRFGLEEGAATSFTCLKEKTKNVFALGEKDLTISWKDVEGDEIMISSDEELMEALVDSLTRQNLPLLRIFVKTETKQDNGPNASAAGSSQGPTHENIVCDGCDGVVRGFRYRCMTCADFDLCAACESKGLHQQHKMVRIPVPEAKGAPRFWWSEQQGPPGHYTAHFGVQADQGGASSFSTSSTGVGCNAGGWGRGGGRGRRGRRHGGGWGWGWFGGRHPGSGFGPQGGDESPRDGKQQEKPKEEQSGQSQHQQHQQQHFNHHQQHQQQHQQQFQQQQQSGQQQQQQNCSWVDGGAGGWCPFMGMPGDALDPQRIQEEAQNIAQEAAQQASEFASRMASDHVANIMKGIWTAWSGQQVSTGDAGGPTHTFSFSSSNSSSSSSSSSASDNANNQGGSAGGSNNRETNSEIPAGVQKEPEAVNVEEDAEIVGSPDWMQTDDTSDKTKDGEEMKVPDSESEPRSVGTSKSKDEVMESDSSSDNEDWMMVNQNAEPKSSAPPEDVIIEQPLPESKSKSPKKDAEQKSPPTPVHPDPKIQQAVEQLQSMGYHNEGGWLTNLVVMKNGDINSILDMLLPSSK